MTTNTLSPLALLQQKIGAVPDGVWGPNTYRSARRYYGFTNNQAAHFFGQCAHESGNFRQFVENLNYSAAALTTKFAKYFPTVTSTNGYVRNPEKIANRIYANRMGNGPESSGDGWKFRGRGAIQLTGANNYRLFAQSISRLDILVNPSVVATEFAFEASLWFFRTNSLLTLAERGVDDATIGLISRRVNGGTHGLADRIQKTKLYATWL